MTVCTSTEGAQLHLGALLLRPLEERVLEVPVPLEARPGRERDLTRPTDGALVREEGELPHHALGGVDARIRALKQPHILEVQWGCAGKQGQGRSG